jgi:lysozyme family protein
MIRDAAIALMTDLEGGYVDNPADPGGATNHGITQRTLDLIRAGHSTLADHVVLVLPTSVRDLTAAQATLIYRAVDWDAINGDQLPAALALLMLNAAVNMGEAAAVRILQECLGVNQDGVMGPHTLAAVGSWRSAYLPAQTLAEEYAARCAVHYAMLSGRLMTFELGWMRRLFRVYTLALS